MYVSIIIPSFNYGRFLAETIESALAQTFEPLEVLVVDDGSTDGSREVAARYPVRILAREHCGAPITMGAGVAASAGDFFVMLGADDRLAPNYLEATTAVMAENDRLGFVYTSTDLFGLVTKHIEARPFSLARFLASNYVHASALTRRSAYDRTRGYASVDLPLYEDWYIFLSMIEQGWSGGCAGGTTLYYRQHGPSRNQVSGRDHEHAIKLIMYDHATLYRPSPQLWYWLHRHLFRRWPRVYVAMLMLLVSVSGPSR